MDARLNCRGCADGTRSAALPPPPPLARPAGDRRGAGRARLLSSPTGCASTAGRPRALRRAARRDAAAGRSAWRSSSSRSSGSYAEVVALRRPARLRRVVPGRRRRDARRSPAFVALTNPVTVPLDARRGRGHRADRRARPLRPAAAASLVGGARFLARTVYERPLRGFRARRDARRVLIVGAGDGGRLVLREILRNPELRPQPRRLRRRRPDQARHAHRRRARAGPHGRARRAILDEAEPDEVTIAIPSAPGTLRARVVRACRERGIPVRTLPTVFELLQAGGGRWSARCARCRSRTSSAASPCGWSSTASAPTSTARS